jgi:Putative DNA-binding domain
MRDGALLVQLDIAVGPAPRGMAETWPDGRAILEGWLEPRGGQVVSFAPGDIGFRWYWTIRLSVPIRGRMVSDIHDMGSDAISLLEAHSDGVVSIDSLSALLRRGHARALVGMAESQILEVKQSLHVQNEKGWLELAKDVSAIANSPSGGLLVVGLTTRSRPVGDVISAVTPVPDTGQVRRVRAALDRVVYPPIERLDVSLVAAGPPQPPNQYLLVITVPPPTPRTWSIPRYWGGVRRARSRELHRAFRETGRRHTRLSSTLYPRWPVRRAGPAASPAI